MQLDKIKYVLYENLKDVRPVEWRERGSKYYHGLRTANLAVRLREIIFPEKTDKDGIITVAAWFHDITNRGTPNHAKTGASLARELLEGLVSGDELDEIAELILLHDDKIDYRCANIPEYSPEVKLLQDADYLDHFGSMWIWDVIRQTSCDDRKFHDLIGEISGPSEEYVVNHLHFEESRRIARERLGFMRYMNGRIKVEADGLIFNEESVIGGDLQ